jgi:hypothetical protein
MSNLTNYARTELETAGLFDKDSDYGGMLGDSVLELVEVFSKQGHSGFSARLCIRLFETVAAFEPLGPLTGEESEWTQVTDGCWQNKRCSHVFKDAEDGPAYDSEGRIFKEPDGSCYQSGDSRVFVEFPYTPTRDYVDRPATD